MSTEPKKTFLKTLGKYVLGPDAVAPVEPVPPETEEAKAAAEKAEAEAKAAEEAAAKAKEAAAAAQARTPEQIAAEEKKAAEDAKVAEEAKAAEAAAAAAKIKPKKSAPLPELDKADLVPDDPGEPSKPKPVAELLDYTPSKSEVRYLDILQAGAARDPEKYQAILDREVDRMKKANAFGKQWEAENPDADPSEITRDPKYRKFLRDHPPAIDPTEHEELREQLVAERAKDAAKAELHKEMEPKLRRVAELETRPVIEQATSAVEQAVLGALPDGDYLHQAAKEGGIAAVGKVPIEGKIVVGVVKRAQALVTEFISLRRGIAPFDAGNEYHVMLSQTVDAAAKIFAEQGGDERIREGRRFVAPRDFAKLTPAAKKKHFTFSDNEVIDILTSQAAATATELIKETRAEMTAAEEFRKPKAPAAKPPGEKPPAKKEEPTKSSPAVSPTPAAPPNPQANGPKNPRLAKMLGIS